MYNNLSKGLSKYNLMGVFAWWIEVTDADDIGTVVIKQNVFTGIGCYSVLAVFGRMWPKVTYNMRK